MKHQNLDSDKILLGASVIELIGLALLAIYFLTDIPGLLYGSIVAFIIGIAVFCVLAFSKSKADGTGIIGMLKSILHQLVLIPGLVFIILHHINDSQVLGVLGVLFSACALAVNIISARQKRNK